MLFDLRYLIAITQSNNTLECLCYYFECIHATPHVEFIIKSYMKEFDLRNINSYLTLYIVNYDNKITYTLVYKHFWRIEMQPMDVKKISQTLQFHKIKWKVLSESKFTNSLSLKSLSNQCKLHIVYESEVSSFQNNRCLPGQLELWALNKLIFYF